MFPLCLGVRVTVGGQLPQVNTEHPGELDGLTDRHRPLPRLDLRYRAAVHRVPGRGHPLGQLLLRQPRRLAHLEQLPGENPIRNLGGALGLRVVPCGVLRHDVLH